MTDKLTGIMTNTFNEDFLSSVIAAVVVLALGWVLIKILLKINRRFLEKSRLDPVLYTFILNLERVFLWIVLGITVLGILGIPLPAFITVIGAIGAALALALKDSLSNFAGGIIILITKPFSKDDIIDDMSIQGRVKQIDLLTSTVVTTDNKVITIPNGKLANSTIINYSREDTRRVDFKFAVGCGEDIVKAREILMRLAAANETIMKRPAPDFGVDGHDGNRVALGFRVWGKTADYWNILYTINEQTKIAFDAAGISVPGSQVDIRMKEKDER